MAACNGAPRPGGEGFAKCGGQNLHPANTHTHTHTAHILGKRPYKSILYAQTTGEFTAFLSHVHLPLIS